MIGHNLLGDAGDIGDQQVAQLPLPDGQNIGHGPGAVLHAGDEQGRNSVGQRTLLDAALLPAQLRHGAGNPNIGLHAQHAVLPAVVIGQAVALLVGAQHNHLQQVVLIQIRKGIFDVVGAHQLLRLSALERVYRQSLGVGTDPPAHNQLLLSVVVQVAVLDAVNGSAAALDHGSLGIGVLHRRVNTDFQGLLVRGIAEEGHRLLLPVAVQILHLHRLNVGAGNRGGILGPLVDHLIDAVVQLRVLHRQGGQTVQILR